MPDVNNRFPTPSDSPIDKLPIPSKPDLDDADRMRKKTNIKAGSPNPGGFGLG